MQHSLLLHSARNFQKLCLHNSHSLSNLSLFITPLLTTIPTIHKCNYASSAASKTRPITQRKAMSNVDNSDSETKNSAAASGDDTSTQSNVQHSSDTLKTFKRTSKHKETAKKKAQSKRIFQVSAPTILGTSAGKSIIRSVHFVGIGLFLYTNYALALYWQPMNDWLLPLLFSGNLLMLFFVRSLAFSNISKVTLLPNYRLRFDRFSWFGAVKPKHSREYNFEEISNITHSSRGYTFDTPSRGYSFSFPLFLWVNTKYSEMPNEDILMGLVKLYQRDRHKFAMQRLNQKRQIETKSEVKRYT